MTITNIVIIGVVGLILLIIIATQGLKKLLDSLQVNIIFGAVMTGAFELTSYLRPDLMAYVWQRYLVALVVATLVANSGLLKIRIFGKKEIN